MAVNKSYEASDIQVLEGLDAVRLRPGMYVGGTGISGLHHILWEIVDNAVDEAANGFADEINVTLHEDGSCEVSDNGRGIPVDKHPKLKVSGVEVVFTQLHAGGKFNNSNYSFSGGLHGVGASVTNALSRYVFVEVFKGRKKYEMRFETVEQGKKIKCGVPVTKLIESDLKKTKRGTTVRFLPDNRVFKDTNFNAKTVKNRLREIAYLNKRVRFTFLDKRNLLEGEEAVQKVYQFDGGLEDFVKYQCQGKELTFEKPLYFCGESNGVLVECAILYTERTYNENIYSFVNNIPTPEGGTHETGFKSGVTKVFNDYARKNNYLKDKANNFLGDDFRVGMTAILSVKMKEVQFEGQTKGKLGTPEAKSAVENVVNLNLSDLLTRKGYGKTMDLVMKKTIEAQKEREQIRKAKEIARQKNSIDNFYLVGKLSSCTGKNAIDNELFIVEGDSAGGTAKQGRDKKTQAILPLRGKPLNVEKNKLEKILANEEIRTIISALGTGILDDFDISALKYHKIIILSDADQDGLHIRSILLTFFYRYMKDLIKEGKVFIGQPPLYKVYKGSKVHYAYNDEELKAYGEALGRGYQVQRYKGLGEMNPVQLKDTTMDKGNRVLVQVTIDQAKTADRMINILMGDAMEERKLYIQENSNFNRTDDFKPTKKEG